MHKREEIINAGREKIGFLDKEILNQNEIVVNLSLPYKPDGVLYGYEVIFEKEKTDRGDSWKFKHFVRTTL